ncbi:MAG: TetR/AcrR family transcriptional regulator [Spirochaetales bacterium]|nr:TetR/AcrR family transcriptional regulator [Spirochaetales bacterium]
MSTREEIITALLDLGEEKGLANVSLSDIALEVGIRKASIYSHFESQQALVDAMTIYCRNQLKQKSPDVDFKAKDAHSMLVSLFDNIVNVFAQKPISSYFSIVQQQRMFDESFAEDDRLIQNMINARIRIALEFCVQRSWLDIRDTDFAADLMTAAVMRKICDVLSDASDWETDRLADGLIELFHR